MATPAPAAVARQQGPPPPGEESWFRRLIGVAQQVFIIYAISQIAGKFLNQAPKATVPPEGGDAQAQVSPFDLPPVQVLPAWPQGTILDLYVFLGAESGEKDLPQFVWRDIQYGNWSESRQINLDVKLPSSVQHNGSLWADVILTKDHVHPNPADPSYDPRAILHFRKLLTRHLPKPKLRKEKLLLSSTTSEVPEYEPEEEEETAIISYWHQNMTLALVSDVPMVPYSQLPPPVIEHVHLVPGARDQTGTKGYYYPIVFPNEFWHLRSQLVEVNETTPTLPLQIILQPMSYFKFQLFASLTAGFQQAAQQQGGASMAELDEIKRMLTETNPWFLGLTALVSVLHVVFEMLAFTSDVSHWRNKQELVGVSVRLIVINVFTQLVVLLYLVDNNEETSWMILMSSGMGVLIEAWKITKAVNIRLVPAPPGSTLPYKLEITDKHVLSEDEKKTQEYDKLAFRYVSYFTIPCLAIYSVYSLMYESHRGWYSYIITTLTSFVYMFGFAQLIPQLIINYKLKSVAHMPMKAMVYKTLSTVIDDLFAFIIKMPLLHRLACFRDDIVFLVFLYQRWIYRIDPKRINEYGQVMAADIDAAANAAVEPAKVSNEQESKKKR
ncbi:cleft lip and palate associated transmembrane protein [Vararia minispora EC-137]|uniref:Cleft lip and palate associated transmembrane protein n=1 Tax=Vararia minispora EC-137 TaxID=1314806 RepID=A0ACB8QQL5_9AGAM|nr:cleft lip and palate associated transmembrane protein [Vararia minispora EC-137]